MPPNPKLEALAKGLEARLRAPCCWNQTLDTHESETVTTLRLEIRQRLRNGQSPAGIEQALVARYGERLRAVPKDGDNRSRIPLGVAAAMIASLAALLVWLRRRRRAVAAAKLPPASGDTPYGRRLDDELRRFDAD